MTRKVTILFLLLATSGFAQRGEDGLTYQERRRQWLRRVPEPRSSIPVDRKRLYFSAWLQKGLYNDTVAEALYNLINEYWLTGGRSHHGYMVALMIKYGSKGLRLIDRDDEQAVLSKYADELIGKSMAYQDLNPNKQMWVMVGVYLYAKYYDDTIRFPIYGHRVGADAETKLLDEKNWPTFSYGGRRYVFGSGPYNAGRLAEDYIKHQLVEWYLGGNREFDSLNYHRAFVGAMILLYDMAPDPELRQRARMAAELAMLDAIMDYGGSEWGGTLGRTDYGRIGKASVFPFYEYFGKGEENTSRPDMKVLYALDYEPPPLLVDLAVLTDEPDDYFHFHKEYHRDTPLKQRDGWGKWNYVTPYYNLGSNVGPSRNGWQLTVRGPKPGAFIRLWINDMGEKVTKKIETHYLGSSGRQFRNALFAQVGSTPIYHERKVRTSWTEESQEKGWHFKRLGKVFVAVGFAESTASVEVALQGVDYASYSDFKAAVKRYAGLDAIGYTTSKGVTIGSDQQCGLDRPGDCTFPFRRMETIGRRGKIISWDNDVMTVRYRGETLTYDFRAWRSEGSFPQDDGRIPQAPTNLRIEAN